MTTALNLTRVKRLLDARRMGDEEAAKVEHAIAQELVPKEVLDCDIQTRLTAHPDVASLRAFEATEVLSDALDVHLARKAKGRYDPKFAEPKAVEDIWRLRQTIDCLGMPYGCYVGAGLQHLGRPHGRAPRLTQLMHREVVATVAGQWVRQK